VKWEKVRLGDVAKVSSSKRIFASQYTKSGVPFYRQKEIIDKKNKNEIINPLFISWETFDDIKKKFGAPNKNDLLITAVGTLGIPYVVVDEIFYFKDGNLIWLSNFDENIHSKYLYYWINSDIGQKTIWSRTIGSAQPALTIDILKQLEIPVPILNTQCKIVKILSAYDALIENNQKQIKLLEEAAQRLYREWFVDFRFPGYEDTKFIDGIPDGWKVRPLSEIFDFIRGKSYASKELVDQGGVIMINLKNIKAFGGYKRNVEKRFIGKFKDEQKILAGDIVMGVTDMTKERRLVGYVAIIPNLGETAIFSMDLIKLIPKTVTRGYLYTTMLYGEYSKRISLLANGVNVLHLKPDAMMGITMLVPSEIIMEQYENKFELYRQKIELLQTQCNIFTEARDRLLPKLMSGEIEV
jgi:hypothetical protein